MAANKTPRERLLQFSKALVVQFRILLSFALNLMAYFTYLFHDGISLHLTPP